MQPLSVWGFTVAMLQSTWAILLFGVGCIILAHKIGRK